MARSHVQLSTGLPGLDRVFRGLMPGDNIVWQVDTVEDYLPVVKPYGHYALQTHQRLIYFRFAEHAPLLTAEDGADVMQLHPDSGFEPFLAEIHRAISEAGRGTLYLFDCLSQLAPDWNSDRMLGNFFMLTCPYLYDRAAIAYFAIRRNFHSFHAIGPISTTTQILVDVYRRHDRLYIHPIKVQHRHSASMYMLHAWVGDEFVPVTQSGIITETLAGVPWSRSDLASYKLGYWSKTFADAESLYDNRDREEFKERADACFHKLVRMLISHDAPVLRLAERYLTLHDVLEIRKRMIGTGLIGGKSVGMLLARAILERADPKWCDILEQHDSFYVGADVFYTYLVQNGCWWMMQKHKSGLGADDETETARRRILAGEFPDYIVKQFADMLDYFGQSPVIVRSSSLLEDNFGNAFAGKYESVFCANQGGRHKRLEDFLCAVRTVYASTMSEEALAYRSERGLLGQDEQMALLIQRVSGATYGNLFYPQAAGVGFSFNPYVWHDSIDPNAGMIRLVFGVGTRAVDRSDDDYTRVVALNAPTRRPEADFDKVREYAQRRVDVLDLEANQLTSMAFKEIVDRSPGLPVNLFVSRDRNRQREGHSGAERSGVSWVLTFDKLLADTSFVAHMREMLHTLHTAYQYPVDIEFTLNFSDSDSYKICLVQCRPLQVRGGDKVASQPLADIAANNLILNSHGPLIGKSAVMTLDWLIYVDPGLYGQLPVHHRHLVARTIGEVTHEKRVRSGVVMLLGPGRWGTTSPELGVPVSFSDINTVSVLCEIVAMRQNLIPDVSLGTHFFNELVEMDMLYLAFFPERDGNVLRHEFFTKARNSLRELAPDAEVDEDVIRVVDLAAMKTRGKAVTLHANVFEQQAVCYVSASAKPAAAALRER